ncbi:MAG TPA: flavodoxin domain-containing protein [Acidimicrobiales bacterium]
MTDRVLVAYGTKYGSTAEIADAIAARLRDAGLDVDLRRGREVRSLDPYRAVVLGSAVYMARWRPEALRVLRRQRRALGQREVWLFSSGPVGEQADEAGERAERWTKPKAVRRLADEVGARDHAVFGGRVREDAGGFMYRSMARNTPPELRDRRDWEAIAAWAQGIAATLAQGAPDAGGPGQGGAGAG